MLGSGKRDARAVTPNEWTHLITRVRAGEGVREVARGANIPFETLRRRVGADNVSMSKRGPQPHLSVAGEAKLYKWLTVNEELGRCVPIAAFKEQAARIARSIGDVRFKGGRDFVERFFKRHPQLSSRTAEMTEHSRMYAVHPQKMSDYFKTVEPLLKDRPSTHVWNVDECGFDAMHIQNGKVVATKGVKQVQSGCDGNRDRISFCFFFNAAGDYLSPIVLLSGKRVTQAKRDVMAAYPEANYILCDSATQTEATWAQCASFFVTEVAKKYPGGKHLLFLDGHSSRVSFDAISAFRSSGNDIFTLPPHSSHVTQPFDVVVAKPLKTNFRRALALIRLGDETSEGTSISPKNIMQGFKTAFLETMAERTDSATGDKYTLASRGFAKSGLVPFNPAIVEERYSKPAQWFEDEIASKKAPQPVPTQEERTAAVEKHTKALLDAGDVAALLEKTVKARREHPVPGSTLLTGDAHIAKSLALEQMKAAADAAAVEKRKARGETAAANKAAKEERAARVAAKKAAKAAAAGNGAAAAAEDDDDAAAAPPAVAPTKGGKRKRAAKPYMEEDERTDSYKSSGERRAARRAAREDDDE